MPRGAKPGERRGGRAKGTPNRLSGTARAVIAEAADQLGGVDGLVAWAQSSPEHRTIFWSRVYPRLVGTIREDDEPKTIGHYIIGDKPMSTQEWIKKFVKED
jgi:hypothetical protein